MSRRVSVSSVTNLISTESLAYIRASRVRIIASLLKPHTRMYCYFDGINVGQYITPEGGAQGDPIITDEIGSVTLFLDIPENAFTVGDKEVLLTDLSIYNPDVVQMKATAIYTAEGTLETYQTIETTTITTTRTRVVQNYDPLAQSFFTYGMEGGIYLTSIDLFFLTKDEELPAWIEVREMVNGYPGPRFVDPDAISVLYPEDINLSDDASVPTRFSFNKLIYLEQDKDYCFVVRSNSDRYNIFTSRMGETSYETGAPALTQPYMGSLFKSENNVTWEPEQYEDIKFVMNRAEFNTNVASNINLAIYPNTLAMETSAFSTVAGSDRIRVEFPMNHALTVDSVIAIGTDEGATYNGIPAEQLKGEFNVVEVISDKVVEFQVPGINPTITGPILTGGQIKDIVMDSQGSGYSDSTQVVITRNGGSGIDATAKPIIRDGKITGVIVTNPGTGYINPPTISFTSTTGTGAAATAINEPLLAVVTNRYYHFMKTMIDHRAPAGTEINARLINSTLGNYEGGPVIHYNPGSSYDIDISRVNYFDNNMLAVTRENEEKFLGTQKATQLSMILSSDNPNVSPVIDLSKSVIQVKANYINNQKHENIHSESASGSLVEGPSGITIVNPGSGYLTAPEVVIHGTGTGAVAECTIVDGQVDSVTVTDGGTGYVGDVVVEFVGGDPVTPASAIANITDYNSELGDNGSAHNRYISKLQSVSQPADGIKVLVTASSNSQSSFEVYVKTSLSSSGVSHDEQAWQMLKCDTDRNLAKNDMDFHDYEFYKYDMEEFDRYSIKIVMRTTTPWQPPRIINYRAIVVS